MVKKGYSLITKLLNRNLLVPLLVLLVILLDQITKSLARHYSPDKALTSFLSITFISNTGAAFGMLKGNNWLLAAVALIIIGALIYFMRIIHDNIYNNVGISLILGGAISNLFDRVVFHYVADFIAFSFWPAFNIADMAITSGIIIFIIFALVEKIPQSS